MRLIKMFSIMPIVNTKFYRCHASHPGYVKSMFLNLIKYVYNHNRDNLQKILLIFRSNM